MVSLGLNFHLKIFLQCREAQNREDLAVEDWQGVLYCCSLCGMYGYGMCVRVDFEIVEDSPSAYISEVVTLLVKFGEQIIQVEVEDH